MSKDIEKLAKEVAEAVQYDTQKFCQFIGESAKLMGSKDKDVIKVKLKMVKALGPHMTRTVKINGKDVAVGYYKTGDVDGTSVELVEGGESVAVSASLAAKMIRDHDECFDYDEKRAPEKGDGSFKTGMLDTGGKDGRR